MKRKEKIENVHLEICTRYLSKLAEFRIQSNLQIKNKNLEVFNEQNQNPTSTNVYYSFYWNISLLAKFTFICTNDSEIKSHWFAN